MLGSLSGAEQSRGGPRPDSDGERQQRRAFGRRSSYRTRRGRGSTMPAVGGAPSPFPTTPTLPHGASSTAAAGTMRGYGERRRQHGGVHVAHVQRGEEVTHRRDTSVGRRGGGARLVRTMEGDGRVGEGRRGELRRRTREGDVRLRWPWRAPRCGPSQGEERQNEARRERLVRREQRRHGRGMQGRLNRVACGEERGCHGQRPAEGCLAVEVGEGWRELSLIPYWKLKNSN